MSLHVFSTIVTPFGVAANNRGETDGNIATLQKLVWHGAVHTTVSAESIRFAIRRRLGQFSPTNRSWNEAALPKPRNAWQDDQFTGWSSDAGETFIDDDLLGFMSAQAAREEATEPGAVDSLENQQKPRKKPAKGTVTLRRAPLEVSRAVSLTAWSGELSFNACSPGANPGSKNKDEPSPYQTELHATRYQYSLALTPERLRDPARAVTALMAICELGPVAGNHGRFLFDFSPESIVLRITQDPAPRLLYCFDTADHGRTVGTSALVGRLEQGDIPAGELILGGEFHGCGDAAKLQQAGAFVGAQPGVKAACQEAIRRIRTELKLKG